MSDQTKNYSFEDVIMQAKMKRENERHEQPEQIPELPDSPVQKPEFRPEIEKPVSPEMPFPQSEPSKQGVRFLGGKKSGKKKKQEEFNEAEDIYYGLQLKSAQSEDGESYMGKDSWNDEALVQKELQESMEAVKGTAKKKKAREGSPLPDVPSHVTVITEANYESPRAQEEEVPGYSGPMDERFIKLKKEWEKESSGSVIYEEPGEAEKEPVFSQARAVTEETPVEKVIETIEQEVNSDVTEIFRAIKEPVHKEKVVPEETARPDVQPVHERRTVSEHEYAPKDRPVHVFEVNWLADALRRESVTYGKTSEEIPEKKPTQWKNVTKEREEEKPEKETDEPDLRFPEQIQRVAREIKGERKALLLHLLAAGISAVVLLIVWLVSGSLVVSGVKMNLSGDRYIPYFILNLVFLAVPAAFCWRMLLDGLVNLFKLRANSDSAVALAMAAAILQAVISFFFPELIASSQLHFYSTAAVCALGLNLAGKLVASDRTLRNFRFAVSKEEKIAVELVSDHNTEMRLAGSAVGENPVIAYTHGTQSLKGFLHFSSLPDAADDMSRLAAPIGLFASLVLFLSAWLMTKSFASAITAFSAATCLCVPFANLLCVNLPVSRLCGMAQKNGGMLSGAAAIEHLALSNAVMVEDRDLFPDGTLVLNGIKTLGGERIDEAILAAASMLNEAGGPLAAVFSEIVKGRAEILPKVEKVEYEDGLGITGWCEGRRILIGNRDLLVSHQINPPPRDTEDPYRKDGKEIIYLACAGEVMAMFVLSYHVDAQQASIISGLEESGYILIIRTCDPNLTPGFLSSLFHTDIRFMRVLQSELGEECKEILASKTQTAPAELAFEKKNRFSALRMLPACVRQKSNMTIAVMLQIIAVVLGFVFVAFMTCFSGLDKLSLTVVLLYEAFWLAVITLVPLIHRP